MVDTNPQLREMMQNPEFVRQLTNPEMVQVQILRHPPTPRHPKEKERNEEKTYILILISLFRESIGIHNVIMVHNSLLISLLKFIFC